MLFKSDLKKEKKEKLLSDIKSWIGSVEKETIKELGDKKLAYPIKQNKKGEYLVLDFQAHNITPEVEKRIQMLDDILRHITLRV